MANTFRSYDELPLECWETILTLLSQQQIPHHQHYLSPISLVCKRFLSISNDLRSQFTITDRTLRIHNNNSISRILKRFPKIKRIDFVEFSGDLDKVLMEIGGSGLEIEVLDISGIRDFPVEGIKRLGEMMKGSLKGLICGKLGYLGNEELMVIARYFDYLEELDISYPQIDFESGIVESFVTDEGIKMIAENLLRLRKFNVSGNNMITNKSLVAISRNLKFLEEIVFLDCVLVTDVGIFEVMRDSPNLVSLVGNGICGWHREVVSSYVFGKSLRCLSFSKMRLVEEFLLALQEANLPLQKLVLRRCKGLSFDILASLLSKYPCLSYLDLTGTSFLTDHMMELLSPCLPNMTYVGLNACSQLTVSAFFCLARNCASLEEIEMEGTCIWEECSDNYSKKNLSIRSLNLAGSKFLDDDCLKKVISVCPNIVSLDISRCSKITNQGVESIGKGCSKIIKLEINGCLRIKSIGLFGFSKLEVLRAAWSGVDDEGLRMIGKRCCELLCLDLEGGLLVSDKGVKDVVENCKKLREVSLKKCCTISVDLVTWMVFSRETLTKIIPPLDFVPAEKQRDLFLRHGCMVHNG